MAYPKSVSEYKKFALMTPGFHTILDESADFMDTKFNQAAILSTAIPSIRRTLREIPTYTKEQADNITDFLNYLEALIEEFNEKPWK